MRAARWRKGSVFPPRSEPEEMLAAELSLARANGWSKMQRTLTSQITVELALDGAPQKLPMPALINLRTHPAEPVRRRAYEAEIAVWERRRRKGLALGREGVAHPLQLRRDAGRGLHRGARAGSTPFTTIAPGARERELQQVTPMTLPERASIMCESIVSHAVLSRVHDRLAGDTGVLENFGAFSPELRPFAERAFKGSWIDAESLPMRRALALKYLPKERSDSLIDSSRACSVARSIPVSA